MTSLELSVRAKRIENALKAAAQAYTQLGLAMMEMGTAVSEFFQGISELQEEQKPKVPEPTNWKM